MPQRTTLPDRLATAMRAAGVKAADLARQKLVSASYLSHILAGEKAPSQRVVRDVARALDVDPHWLATGDGEMRPAGSPSLARYERPEDQPEFAGPLGSWTAALRPLLVGTPIEGAVPAHTITREQDRAWLELSADRKREVIDTLRGIASVSVLVAKLMPPKLAEEINETLADKVAEYLADAF